MGSLYFTRHGQTTCNADGIIQGPRIDSELSDLGHAQATAVAQSLSGAGLDVVFSSPMRRARDTAAAIAKQAGDLEVRIVPELYEMDYGAFCGRRIDEVRSEIDQLIDAWQLGFTSEAFPDGESPVVTQHRLAKFIERIKLDGADMNVAVVAHGRVNRIMVATLVGAELTELEQYPQSNANITQVVAHGKNWVVQRLNDTSHLEESSTPFS